MNKINSRAKQFRRLTIFFTLFLQTSLSFGGIIYYVCDNGASCGAGWNTGNNLNAGTSASAPLKTIKAGVNKLTPGDTLIVGDGVYTGIDNMISGPTWSYDIPSGTPGNYITIKAEHYLGAVIDGQETYRPVHIESESYIIFENFYFKNSEANNGGANFRADKSNHIKVLNTGSEEGGHAHYWFRYSKYILVEDAFAFGRGTYYFAFVGSSGIYTDSQYNVCRRCVARLDYHHYLAGGNWFAPFVAYWADNTYFQNCISIDGIEWPAGDSQAVIKGFYTANGGSNYSAEGSIILNEDGSSATFESGENNVNLKNDVMWGKKSGFFQCCSIGGSAVYLNNTMGVISGAGADGGFGIYNYKDYTSGLDTPVNVKNSIFYKTNQTALLNVPANSYNALYANGNNYSGTTPGTGEVTTKDPLTNGLKYLPRVEDASFLKTAGASSGQIGAGIVKKIGTPGTFYGDPGWNAETTENLWPFPHEDKIKEKMSAYNLHGVNGARGFSAAGNGLYGGPITLTSYIWEYLGNACPADICSSGSPPPAPNNPPSASITVNLSSGAAPLTVRFTGAGADTDGTIASYAWSFGDGTTSNQQSPSYTYNTVGNYTVALTVTDNQGATGVATVSITVTVSNDTPPARTKGLKFK